MYKLVIYLILCFLGIMVKGVVDDLDFILKVLEWVGYMEDCFYIYVDGVFFGFMMLFVKKVSIFNIFEDVLLV